MRGLLGAGGPRSKPQGPTIIRVANHLHMLDRLPVLFRISLDSHIFKGALDVIYAEIQTAAGSSLDYIVASDLSTNLKSELQLLHLAHPAIRPQ